MQETTPRNLTTLYQYDTVFSADSVEWCPHSGYQNIFVCANYQLDDNDQEAGTCKRLGRILVFSITPVAGLKLLQTINTAAVLDQKWCCNKINNKILLGVVNAKKSLEIYSLNSETLDLKLLCNYEIKDDDKDTLLLSLDWSTGKYESTEPEMVCSDSRGNIHIFRFANDELILENTYHGHQFEAWIAGFYYWDVNVFFSGGDDSIFCKFDKRCGQDAVVRNKTHEAGVTSFHANSKNEYMIATGSYDENVRLWDSRKLKSPVSTVKMPGTLWRLKWDPFYHDRLLAACMLGGVHVLDTSDSTDLNIIGSYFEHKNIAYGADWCHMTSREVADYTTEGNIIIGTCSFYDHLLCISSFSHEI